MIFISVSAPGCLILLTRVTVPGLTGSSQRNGKSTLVAPPAGGDWESVCMSESKLSHTRQQSAHQQRGTHPTIRWSHAIFKAFSGCNVLLGNQFAIGDVVAANLLFYRKSRKTNPRNNDQAKLLFSFLLLSDGRCQGAFAASLPQLPAVLFGC